MNNDQEIEKMENKLCCSIEHEYYGSDMRVLNLHKTAKNLIMNGIGDKKQAVKEVLGLVHDLIPIYCDNSHQLAFHKAIDELFIELYGAKE